MKNYVILYGKLSSFDQSNQVYTTVVGMVDPSNPDNVLSIKDMCCNRRIVEVLYNMGIAFEVTNYKSIHAVYGGNGEVGESVYSCFKHVIREGANPDCFNAIVIDGLDVWDYDMADGKDGVAEGYFSTKEEQQNAIDSATMLFKTVLREYCPDYTDDDYSTISCKIRLAANIFYYDQYMNLTGTLSYPYYLMGGSVTTPDVIQKNIRFIDDTGSRALQSYLNANVQTPISDIMFEVPSFFDLACTKNYKKDSQERVLSGIGMDDDEQSMNDVENNVEQTSFFSKKSENKGDYTDLYLPIECRNAITEIFDGNDTIPLINPKRINVARVTKYYRVCPATEIPEEEYGIKSGGESYGLNDLIGNVSNNHLLLQDSEKGFYNKLCNLVKVGICIEHNLLSDNVFNKSYSNAIFSEVAEDYLKTLSEQWYNLNWCHTGMTQPIYANNELFDDDELTGGDDSVEIAVKFPCMCGRFEYDSNLSQYVFVNAFSDAINTAKSEAEISSNVSMTIRSRMPRLYLGFDGSEEMNFVHHDSALCGYVNLLGYNLRWVDTLIRLMRWGERKPTMLSYEHLDGTEFDVNVELSDNVPAETDSAVTVNSQNKTKSTYWNLNTGELSKNDGDIDGLKSIVNEKTGNAFDILSIVKVKLTVPIGIYKQIYGEPDFSVAGADIIVNVPLGIVFQETKEGGTVHNVFYEDIFTYYDKLKRGERRGHLICENGKIINYEPEKGMIIPEMDLTADVITTMNAGRFDNQDEVTGKIMMYRVFVESNPDILTSRNAISSKFTDSYRKQAYDNQAKVANTFNSFCIFRDVYGIQESMLKNGKKFNSTGVPFETMGYSLENARIVYLLFDKYVRLNYSSVIEDNISFCDMETLFNNLDKLNEKKVIGENQISKDNYDSWDEFEKMVESEKGMFIPRLLTSKQQQLPVGLLIHSDRSVKKIALVATTKSNNQMAMLMKKGLLQNNTNLEQVALSEKYIKILSAVLASWNKYESENNNSGLFDFKIKDMTVYVPTIDVINYIKRLFRVK